MHKFKRVNVLYAVKDADGGVRLTPYDPAFEAQMEAARKGAKKMGDVVFSSATFRDVSLAESDLRQSDFVGCEASGIDFSFADLRGAKLTSAFFLYPVFFKARVAGSQIADAELVASPAYEELEVAGGDDEPLNESDVQALRELRTMSDSLLGSVSLRQGATALAVADQQVQEHGGLAGVRMRRNFWIA